MKNKEDRERGRRILDPGKQLFMNKNKIFLLRVKDLQMIIQFQLDNQAFSVLFYNLEICSGLDGTGLKLKQVQKLVKAKTKIKQEN